MDNEEIPAWQTILGFLIIVAFFVWFLASAAPEEPKYIYVPGHWEKEPVVMND